MPRWADRLQQVGDEPDPRFTLANERTFLAWIRTALGLVAAGVALGAFVTAGPPWLPATLAVVVVALGAVTAATAFTRWLAAERALRLSRPLPLPGMAPVLALGLAGLALLALAVVIAG